MKLDKNAFKAVVKECLIEILAEGLVNEQPRRQKTRNKKRALTEALSQKTTDRVTRQQSLAGLGTYNQNTNRPTKRQSYLDSIKYENTQQPSQQQNQYTQKAQKITKDPVMQSILSDTANTTLREQLTAEHSKTSMAVSRPADNAARIVSESDPTELFEGASKNWATLAFS
jgi:hypothetical protein